jgi:hypothetical protein
MQYSTQTDMILFDKFFMVFYFLLVYSHRLFVAVLNLQLAISID